MKNLIDYINESLMYKVKNVWTLNPRERAEFIKYLDATFLALKNDRIFSLDNKEDCKKIYNVFKDKSGMNDSQFIRDRIASYGIKDPQSFRSFILGNHDQFVKYHFNIDWVLQWNETEIEKKYKAWKESNDYVESIDDESAEERDLIVYDRWNPEIHAAYPFHGKRGKSTDHQVNMLRLEFHYDYDVKYYDCYPILAKNYYGHEEELKKRAQDQIGYDDPNEFK